MKSLKELQELRDKMKVAVGLREDAPNNTRVVVGMATCGIAAGARPVLTAFNNEITKRGITNVTVGQTGCIGICQYEPIVEVLLATADHSVGGKKVTYVNMTAEKAVRIAREHLAGGKIVEEYTIGAAHESQTGGEK